MNDFFSYDMFKIIQVYPSFWLDVIIITHLARLDSGFWAFYTNALR